MPLAPFLPAPSHLVPKLPEVLLDSEAQLETEAQTGVSYILDKVKSLLGFDFVFVLVCL